MRSGLWLKLAATGTCSSSYFVSPLCSLLYSHLLFLLHLFPLLLLLLLLVSRHVSPRHSFDFSES